MKHINLLTHCYFKFPELMVLLSYNKCALILQPCKYYSYPCNRREDAALRGLVPVEGGAGHKADEPGRHGGGGDAEADVHPGVRLHPDQRRQRDELAGAEAEVGRVEVGGEPLGIVRRHSPPPPAGAAAGGELVGAVRDHVGLEAAAAERHQVERREEDAGLDARGLLAAAVHGRHAARRRLQLRQVRLH
uniref:Uncharacterized protein n=1 Tax=Oryza brachyantha TaxID=4533 RepID=J3LY59_ORYBR